MKLGGSILGVRILDPLAGLLVAGMIMKAGLETGYQRHVFQLLSYFECPFLIIFFFC